MEIRIVESSGVRDSVIEMGEVHGPYQPMQSMFCLYVPDTIYRRALAAGAKSVSTITE